jgi:hypothetical protein
MKNIMSDIAFFFALVALASVSNGQLVLPPTGQQLADAAGTGNARVDKVLLQARSIQNQQGNNAPNEILVAEEYDDEEEDEGKGKNANPFFAPQPFATYSKNGQMPWPNMGPAAGQEVADSFGKFSNSGAGGYIPFDKKQQQGGPANGQQGPNNYKATAAEQKRNPWDGKDDDDLTPEVRFQKKYSEGKKARDAAEAAEERRGALKNAMSGSWR